MQLSHLFQLLEGDSDPNSLRHLNNDAKRTLLLVNKTLHQVRINEINPHKDIQILTVPNIEQPLAIIFQQPDCPFEFIHLPHHFDRKITPYHSMIIVLIQRVHLPTLHGFDKDPVKIILPFT